MALRLISISMLLIISTLCGFCQFDNRRPTNSLPDTLADEKTEIKLDTTIYNVVQPFLTKPSNPFVDTSLHQYHIYDPVRKDYAANTNLGNMGSATLPLYYKAQKNVGFNVGYHQYDCYRKEISDFYLFDLNRPFNNFFFSPGKSQTDFIVKANFSRNFNKGINFTVDYQRIFQDGYYTSQQTRSTYLAVGFWQKRKNHDLIISAIVNANNDQHNGGVENDTSFNLPSYNFRELITTNLDMGQTRHADKSFRVQNIFYLRDSIPSDWKTSIHNTVKYESASYKYYDESITSSESSLYAGFINGDTGIRNYTSYNNVGANGYLQVDHEQLIKLNAGIEYDYYNVYQEPNRTHIHNLFLSSQLETKFFPLTAQVKLGLLDNGGDYVLNVNSELLNTELLTIKAKGAINNSSPFLIYQKLYVNKNLVWENEFSKMQSQSLNAILIIPKLGAKADIGIKRINNLVYYDNPYRPSQAEGDVSILQFSLSEKVKLWKFTLLHHIHYQQFSNNLLGLPRLYMDLDYFIEGKIFKNKMLSRVGVNTRIINSYYPVGFSPVLGQFYTQTDKKQEWVTLIDAYASFKVHRFRAFFKFENLGHLMFNKVYFMVHDHPHNDFTFRFGLAWSFKD